MYNIYERGNALFMILLGVVLFAALSYAVQQNFRGGNERLSQTRIEALADDVIITAAGYEKAVNKLINNGISESRVSFTLSSGDAYELSPVADVTEKVFSITGGGGGYLTPPKDVLDTTRSGEVDYGAWIFTGAMNVLGIGTQGSGTGTKELLAILPYVRKEICVNINKRLGITNPSDSPPVEASAITLTKFTGIFTSGSNDVDTTGNHIQYQKAGCFEGNNGGALTGRYYFYYTLLER